MIKLYSFFDYIKILDVQGDKPKKDNTVSISYYKLPASISGEIETFVPLAIKKVTLSREEIDAETDTRKKIIKIIVWGYSNDSRGIGSRILGNSLDRLVDYFNKYQGKEVSDEIIQELFRFPGIRISTASKILYFMKVTIGGYPAIIVDSRVQQALPLFEELCKLPKGDDVTTYRKTVTAIGAIAKDNGLEADHIEYFLFNCGKVWTTHLSNRIKAFKKEEMKKADFSVMEKLLSKEDNSKAN